MSTSIKHSTGKERLPCVGGDLKPEPSSTKFCTHIELLSEEQTCFLCRADVENATAHKRYVTCYVTKILLCVGGKEINFSFKLTMIDKLKNIWSHQ